ncbi:serine hydrolase [Candidatus Saccharibacteria bacterium]|nr:serine hydrolase [Candidatus Saccharibacteria bacterium]
MVHQSSKPSKALVWLTAIFLLALTTISGIKIILSLNDSNNQIENPSEQPEEPEEETPEPEEVINDTPAFIDLQAIVDSWASSLGSNAGVYIYDLDNDKEAAIYNSDTTFSTASVYKLFFVYEAYLRINQGIDDPNAYFADGKTRIECLDLIIRESYNPCADPLRAEMKYEIDDIIANKFKIEDTINGALSASPKAVGDMLKIYYKHEGLSDELWGKIADSMLNQPATTYDWRQGLPKGFSAANVYNKVGWSYDGERWTIYNDAAIVEFPDLDRHYIVVALTRNTSNRKLVELGQKIEQTILANN